ncbi:MAG: hypothetical protein NT157_06470 [Candidatus Micrarchaeota archaeon]|nr:hypothetical protein [Candidatus Micrarchaeota archaeon]
MASNSGSRVMMDVMASGSRISGMRWQDCASSRMGSSEGFM